MTSRSMLFDVVSCHVQTLSTISNQSELNNDVGFFHLLDLVAVLVSDVHLDVSVDFLSEPNLGISVQRTPDLGWVTGDAPDPPHNMNRNQHITNHMWCEQRFVTFLNYGLSFTKLKRQKDLQTKPNAATIWSSKQTILAWRLSNSSRTAVQICPVCEDNW